MEILETIISTSVKTLKEAATLVFTDYNFQAGIEAWFDRDFSRAYKYFEVSAKNHPVAQYHMGCMLFTGRGTNKNYLKALAYFKTSASYVPQAIYSLADIYLQGTVGVPQNKQEALHWLNIIAIEDQEFAVSQRDLLENELSDEEVISAQQSSADWLKENSSWNQYLIWASEETTFKTPYAQKS